MLFTQGFKQKNGSIATQMPMQQTVTDFWRLVWDHGSKIIVMLNHLDPEEISEEVVSNTLQKWKFVYGINLARVNEIALSDLVPGQSYICFQLFKVEASYCFQLFKVEASHCFQLFKVEASHWQQLILTNFKIRKISF